MTASTNRPSRVTPDRQHMLRGKRNLDWFFENRRWLRLVDRSVQAAYALRPLPESEAPIQFLLIAAKRDMKHAHDRNRSKRWLREAILCAPEFAEIERKLQAAGSLQVLLLLRLRDHPDRSDFSQVRNAVERAALSLSTELTKLLEVAAAT